jgi:hypothetical protein
MRTFQFRRITSALGDAANGLSQSDARSAS